MNTHDHIQNSRPRTTQSINLYIRETYEEREVTKTLDYGKTLKNLARLRNHQVISLRCKNADITLSSLKIDPPVTPRERLLLRGWQIPESWNTTLMMTRNQEQSVEREAQDLAALEMDSDCLQPACLDSLAVAI